jgi:hypothetical protein
MIDFLWNLHLKTYTHPAYVLVSVCFDRIEGILFCSIPGVCDEGTNVGELKEAMISSLLVWD